MSVQRTVDIVGTLASLDRAQISSEVAGLVQDVPVTLGQDVKAGEILVDLDPRELELALERAHSALRQTEAQLGIPDNSDGKAPPLEDEIASVRNARATMDDARAQNERAEELASRSLLSKSDLEGTRTRLEVAVSAYQAALDTVHSLEASLEDRRAALTLAQKKYMDAMIKAPVAGSVSERLVQPGQFIRENTPVVTLVQTDPLKLVTAVQERYAGAVRVGMPASFSVEAFPGEVFYGQVVSLSPAVDQATRTFTVEVEVANKDRRLKPGFFAKGAVLTHIDDRVVAVPEDAISTLGGVSTVFVIDGAAVKPRQVTLGTRKDNVIEIVDGLKGGETLAGSNLNLLADGVRVQVRN